MKNIVKNKLVLWVIGILVLANLVTLVIFWAGRMHPMSSGSPREFLAEKLNFDENQKKQYFDLAKEHHENAQIIREKIKESKDAFFDLIKEPNVSDSTEKAAARKVSLNLEELDLYTLGHFKKVRAICNPEQKKSFDEIIHQITGAVSDQNNRPPMQQNGPPPPPNAQPMPPNPPQ
jgi:Spy/CpxP family protein refolding chaperone